MPPSRTAWGRVARVARTTRCWSVVPAWTARAGVSGSRPAASRASTMACTRFTPMRITRVGMRASADQSVMLWGLVGSS